jgi:DNA uptake protein ComE-like DNA-binding protein
MWKDFFYFSRGQRIGIVTLIVLIVLALGANYTLKYFFPVTERDGSAFLTEAEAFKRSLVSRDSLRNVEWNRKYEERQRMYEEKYKNNSFYPSYISHEKKKDTYTLFNFDPNIIDSVGFVRLGLKPFIASNILKYRSKGGRFKVTADFAKVFGIMPDKFKELEPYIAIAEIKPLKNDVAVTKRTDIIVELNSADTMLLMQVKGIGRGYAKSIVRFRQAAGGFVSVDQLNDIYGMMPENLEKIRPFLTVNTSLVQKIRINTASVDRLKSHPYLNFYKAKAIYEFRRNKGKLRDMNDLKVVTELTTEDLIRIKPYLSFE